MVHTFTPAMTHSTFIFLASTCSNRILTHASTAVVRKVATEERRNRQSRQRCSRPERREKLSSYANTSPSRTPSRKSYVCNCLVVLAVNGNCARRKTDHCSYFFVQSTMVQVESNKRDNDALKVTTALLRKSPDYYTIWNVRRTILKEGFLDNAYVHAAVF